MLALLPLIQKLILDYMTKKTHDGFSFNFQAMGLFTAAGILLLLVFLFLLFAMQTYTAQIYGEPVSWLITAGTTLLVTGIVYLCACYSKRKKGLMHKVKEEVEDRLTPVAQIIEQLAEPVKDHPIAAVILAGLAGVMAGEKLHSPDKTQDKGTES